MRSHLFRMLCLAGGVGALFAACGGGDEEETRSVLAVAFRLDEGTPVMAAYSGDADEDPLWLAAGRYYIEAIDEADMAVSLGTVDVEAGEAVDFPASFADASGVADPGRAGSLVTMANFLVDVELSKYTSLEIVSGGFQQPLFDPDVEVSPADLETLFTLYSDIADQEDAVLTAFHNIQTRAEVSSGVSYVQPASRTAPRDSKDDMEDAYTNLGFLFVIMVRMDSVDTDKRDTAIADTFLDLAESQNEFEAKLARPWGVIGRSDEIREKTKAWREYAQKLAAKISTADEEAGRQRAREELAEEIAKDLQDWLAKRGNEVTAPQVDRAVDILVNDVFESIVAPADIEPAWIGGYVTAMYDHWRALGYSDWEAAKAATDLRACLSEEVAAGASQEEALARCPIWQYEPQGTPKATPAATPAETPSPTPTPNPDTSWIEGFVQGIADGWLAAGYGGIDVAVADDDLRQCLTDAVQGGAGRDEAIGECPTWLFEPQGSPEPTPTPTPTPAPGLRTARGKFTFVAPGQTDTENTMTLVWNSTGGPITFGEGRRRTEWPAPCGTEWSSFSRQYTGTYDPESRTFSGTYSGTGTVHYWYLDTQGKCAEDNRSGIPDSGPWGATWEDNVVRSTAGSDFSLTVEGQ